MVTEESMRLDARTRVIHREAAEDIEVPGGTIKSGPDMFFWIGSGPPTSIPGCSRTRTTSCSTVPAAQVR